VPDQAAATRKLLTKSAVKAFIELARVFELSEQ
jgi:hypothetical protein